MVRPIRGSQVIPPVPNNVQAECICVPKVYDFVVFTEDINATVPLPATPPVGCPTTVTDIFCSLTTEPFFPITCATNGVCTVLDRRPINIDGVNAALVKLRQDIPVDVTLTGTDALGNPASCTIPLLVPFIRQVVLCFPPEFTNDNLVCRIISGDCVITTPPPVGGTPFPASVGIELNVCKEIQVLAAVKLEVLAKFCSPRPPIDIPVTSVCPPLLFPEQCDFFPQPNCGCQSTFNSTNAAVPVSVIVVLNGLSLSVGTASLVGNICNACAEINTDILFTYTDTDSTAPNNSFTFTANSFTREDCGFGGGTGVQVVVGEGTVVTAGGDTIPVRYTLQLVDSAVDTYILILSSVAPGLFASTVVSISIGNSITVQDCNAFPAPTT
ncbi:hypothetical protein [Shimazuella kribbensis]|uniref:hypothetical protein n=1 Tax=Shimazuella kribbensis TaxID=139808 RepID=UPI000407CAF5|nr:hypothetical protein [Shimazuella kribbensis]